MSKHWAFALAGICIAGGIFSRSQDRSSSGAYFHADPSVSPHYRYTMPQADLKGLILPGQNEEKEFSGSSPDAEPPHYKPYDSIDSAYLCRHSTLRDIPIVGVIHEGPVLQLTRRDTSAEDGTEITIDEDFKNPRLAADAGPNNRATMELAGLNARYIAIITANGDTASFTEVVDHENKNYKVNFFFTPAGHVSRNLPRQLNDFDSFGDFLETRGAVITLLKGKRYTEAVKLIHDEAGQPARPDRHMMSVL